MVAQSYNVKTSSKKRRNCESCGIFQNFSEYYAKLLVGYPVLVILICLAVCQTLTYLAYRYTTPLDFSDPKLGFESRGTEWSGRVLAHNAIQASMQYKKMATNFQTYSRQARSIPIIENSDHIMEKRNSDVAGLGDFDKIPEWLKQFFTKALGSTCSQLETNVETLYQSQIIFEAKSAEAFFTPEAIFELCDFQNKLKNSFKVFKGLTPFKHVWSLPNYIACMTGKSLDANCADLTEDDIKNGWKKIQECTPFYHKIIDCAHSRRNTSGELSHQTVNHSKTICSKVPANCSGQLISDIFYRILSNGIADPKTWAEKPIFVDFYFPFFVYEAYLFQGFGDRVPVSKFQYVLESVDVLSRNLTNFKIPGSHFGIKLDLFALSLTHDTWFGGLALVIVIALIAGYSGSLFYTFMVGLCLQMSLGVAYFLYEIVFQTHFFPFINLLVFVLLVGIGADDTFVLNFIFDRAKKSEKLLRGSDAENHANSTRVSGKTIEKALSHAALSMFVTSVTTAAAFFANVISDVAVVKCFGLFAGITMLVNYLLVVSWLPAALILAEKYINPLWSKCLPKFCRACCENAGNSVEKLSKYILEVCLPTVVHSLKFVWIFLFCALMLASTVLIFWKPGLTLPSRNPVQVFKNNHPFEWYDYHMEVLFPFAEAKYHDPLFLSVTWGFLPTKDASIMNAKDTGTLTEDTKFHVKTLSDVRAIHKICKEIHNLPIVENRTETKSCWFDKFFQWSANQACFQRSAGYSCCNVESEFFDEKIDLVPCLRYASRHIENTWDTPIFNANSEKVVAGYFMEFQTVEKYSAAYSDLREFFEKAEMSLDPIFHSSESPKFHDAFFVTSFSLTTVWYDLLGSLLHGTPISVLVSVIVALFVVVITTRTIITSLLSILTITGVILNTVAMLVVLHWRISIVESTIIILTVGLSFDFTLHYAVAYKLSPKGTRKDKVSHSFGFIGLPVLLSALTTFFAGAAMLPSVTQSFYQIGVFMMLVTAFSWVYSSLFFMSLMATFGPEERECAYQPLSCCDDDDLEISA